MHMRPGPRNLITDVAGLRVGNAEDAALKSGVTCLTAESPFVAGVDIRGGAPGTRETALLAPGMTVDRVDALVLSGGSAFGLDAASGVAEGVLAAGRGFAVGPARVPLVPAAIIFDLLNGGDKDWTENPYRALGRTAFDAATDGFDLGTAGAGTGALTARLKGGLGSASAVAEGYTVGALAVVNPIGCVTMPDSRHFWAWPWEVDAEFGRLGPPAEAPRPLGIADTKLRRLAAEGTSTTIAIVATDARLDKAGATRLAVAAHDGIARAIVPAHTPMDGDLVFGVSTGAKALSAPIADAALLGHMAATTLARAIARAVYLAEPAPKDTLPTYRTLD